MYRKKKIMIQLYRLVLTFSCIIATVVAFVPVTMERPPSPPVSFMAEPVYGLDIHCGTGDSTARMRRRNPGMEIIGIEDDLSLIQRARQRYPNLLFYCGDLCEMMEFFQRSIAVVQVPIWEVYNPLLLSRLHHILSPLGEVRVIDEDGRVLYHLDPRDLLRMME
jgi:SAM-dependent methyltransferase